VVAGIVPRDGGPIDLASITDAWIRVAVATAVERVLH
jgi:hypothetical protein